MIGIQSAAYLWFQAKGGVVSHKKFIIYNLLLMIGQSGQAIESITKNALASFTVSAFFFLMSAIGIIKRYMMIRKHRNAVIAD